MELPDLPGPRLWLAWGPVMGEGGRCLRLGGGGAGACGRRGKLRPAPGAGARPSRRSPAGTWRLPGWSWMGGAGWRWWWRAERRSAWARSRGEARRALVDRCFRGWPAGRCCRFRSRPAWPMTPASGGGDGEPGSATAPARRKLIFGPESCGSWREAAGATGTCGSAPSPSPASTVTGPGSATRSCGAAHAPWSGLDWEAKLSHLEDPNARLAAVDQDAGQLAGEATHDLVEALLWSLAAELRGSGLATPPRSPWPWWPTCRPHRRAPGLRPVDAHRHAGRTALAAGRRDLALEVFAAANRPGLQQDCLAGRCLELTGQPPPRHHLRAVQEAGRADDAAAPWPSRLSRSCRSPRAHLAPAPGGRPGPSRCRSGQTGTTARRCPAAAGAARE